MFSCAGWSPVAGLPILTFYLAQTHVFGFLKEISHFFVSVCAAVVKSSDF